MNLLREVDAYCGSCKEVKRHAVVRDDPSVCFCNACGSSQLLVAPVTRAPEMVAA